MRELWQTSKILFMIVVSVIVASNTYICAYSEEDEYRPEDRCFYNIAESFAFTDQYALFAKAMGTKQYAWFPDTVYFDLMTISVGEKVRIAEIPSTWAQVFTDGECFYVVESNYLDEDYDGPFTISIGKIEPEKKSIEWLDTLTFGVSKSQWEETLTFDTKGYYWDDRIRDIHLDNGKLYFISYYKIYTYDLSTLELNVVYQSEKKIINRIAKNRSFLYKDKLYIHKEDSAIYEIELTSLTERMVVYDAENLSSDNNKDIYRAPYSYYIFNDTLYYCTKIDSSKKTCAINLTDGRKTEILQFPITIFLINEQGIYFDIHDGDTSRYFLNFYDNTITPIPIKDFKISEIMIEIMN